MRPEYTISDRYVVVFLKEGLWIVDYVFVKISRFSDR